MTIGGMTGGLYFAESPIIITLGGLSFPSSAIFRQVKLEVTTTFNGVTRMYPYPSEVGDEVSLDFDISSSLRAAMLLYDFQAEIAAANQAIGGTSDVNVTRQAATFTLRAYYKYMLDGVLYDEQGVITNNGGKAVLGKWDELERYTGVATQSLSSLSASRKPTAEAERVGADSVLTEISIAENATSMTFTKASRQQTDVFTLQGRTILRDSSQEYTDFLFVNQRGAVEAVSAVQRESLSYPTKTTASSLVSRPSFSPSVNTKHYPTEGPATWKMSSGWQTRDWLTWWATEFLRARMWWMRIGNRFLPVNIKPANESTEIYDRAKQALHDVTFTVELALNGAVI